MIRSRGAHGVAWATAMTVMTSGCFSVMDPSLARTGLREGMLLAEHTAFSETRMQPEPAPGEIPPATAPGTPTVAGPTPSPNAAAATGTQAVTPPPQTGAGAPVASTDVQNPAEVAYESRAVEDTGHEGPPRDTSERRQRVRTGLFWTGIAFLAIGGAGTIAFGAAGRAAQAQLDDGYDEGTLTRAREDELTGHGEVMNSLAITTGVFAIAGLSVALITFGLDYTACGKLARRKRPDCQPKR